MPRDKRPQKPRYRVAIVGDGQTERIYFSDVRDTDRPANLAIFPDYPRKIGSYQGVIERAVSLTNEYDRVYALIDRDKILQDRRQTEYQQAKTEAEARGVIVLEHNPCFEMWLLVHFVFTGKLFGNYAEVSDMLQRYIPEYGKSERFLQRARLYGRYKTQLKEQAIANARRLEQGREDKDALYPRAQAYQFFEWYLTHNW